MYAENDRENGVDFYDSVFPGEVKMCLGFKIYTKLIQNLYAENDKENGVDVYNSVFPGEVKMCLGFMSFRAQKNYHNSPNMSPIITLFDVLCKVMKRHLLTIVSK